MANPSFMKFDDTLAAESLATLVVAATAAWLENFQIAQYLLVATCILLTFRLGMGWLLPPYPLWLLPTWAIFLVSSAFFLLPGGLGFAVAILATLLLGMLFFHFFMPEQLAAVEAAENERAEQQEAEQRRALIAEIRRLCDVIPADARHRQSLENFASTATLEACVLGLAAIAQDWDNFSAITFIQENSKHIH